MERFRKYLKWLANIIPQAKSILIMKEIIFDKEERAVLRAMIYFLQVFFIGVVLISVVDYFTQLAGIESGFGKNIIFVFLFSIYAGTNILDVMLKIDEMRKEFEEKKMELEKTLEKKEKEYEKALEKKEKDCKKALEEANKRADSLEELLIGCRYSEKVCEMRLRKFQLYFEKVEPIFADIQRSKAKSISKSAILKRYKQAKESFEKAPTEFMSFEGFRAMNKGKI